MNGNAASGGEGGGARPSPPVEPVDIAEFGRLTATPPPDQGSAETEAPGNPWAPPRPWSGAAESAAGEPTADLAGQPDTVRLGVNASPDGASAAVGTAAEPGSPAAPPEGDAQAPLPWLYGRSPAADAQAAEPAIEVAATQPPTADDERGWGAQVAAEGDISPAGEPLVEEGAWQSAPMTGPVGRHRSPLAVAVLSLVTLGLYTIVWHARVNREMSDYDFSLDVHPGRTAAAITVPWVLALGVTLVGVARIVVQLAHIGLPFDPLISAQDAVLLLPAVLVAPILVVLVPVSLVAAVMTAERLRLVENLSGLATDQQVRPAALVWVLLLPLIGGLVLLSREQARLNAAWERGASRASPGWTY